MSQVMRGNFEPKKKVSGGDTKEDLNTRFEREALKRLGGSIAFVSKKKFLFGHGGPTAQDPQTPSGHGGPTAQDPQTPSGHGGPTAQDPQTPSGLQNDAAKPAEPDAR
jgi:hypothetical protein